MDDYNECYQERFSLGRVIMFEGRQFRIARLWSNKEIKKLAPLFGGKIVNVSAWDDRDKQGGYYRDYFIKKSNYYLTNYYGVRGYQGSDNEYILDLTKELPEDLIKQFDVVFNHTTLEHIFDIQKAFKNLCNLSRDVVMIVVPFSQVQHETNSFKDYWRFTPTCLQILFETNGFEVVYINSNNDRNAAIYIFCIASRNPDKWKPLLPEADLNRIAGECIGSSTLNKVLSLLQRYRGT